MHSPFGRSIIALALLMMAGVTDAKAAPFSFSDNFVPSPSPDWNNLTGNWAGSGGTYYAQAPNNSPLSVSLLPFDFTNSNLVLTVTINNIGDGGILVDSDATNQNGVLLVLGGFGYGQGTRGGSAGTSAYWHVIQNGSYSSPQAVASGVISPGATDTVSVTVNGDTFSAYLDPDGVFDVNSILLTSFSDPTFTGGQVGLYDDQPNDSTGGGFGPAMTFSGFSVQGDVPVPAPGALALLGLGLIGIGGMQRKAKAA